MTAVHETARVHGMLLRLQALFASLFGAGRRGSSDRLPPIADVQRTLLDAVGMLSEAVWCLNASPWPWAPSCAQSRCAGNSVRLHGVGRACVTQGPGLLLPEHVKVAANTTSGASSGEAPRYLLLYLKHLLFYVDVLSREPLRDGLKNEKVLIDVLVDGPARTLARLVFESKAYDAAENLGARLVSAFFLLFVAGGGVPAWQPSDPFRHRPPVPFLPPGYLGSIGARGVSFFIFMGRRGSSAAPHRP